CPVRLPTARLSPTPGGSGAAPKTALAASSAAAAELLARLGARASTEDVPPLPIPEGERS
ncbi:hypothetical protein, partial [Kitasatospora nipponensis]|uniref:hypothetical protein n=1 Tax=Kitasatospora nipponensis TaxID=258049 RepID=UPI0031E39A7B